MRGLAERKSMSYTAIVQVKSCPSFVQLTTPDEAKRNCLMLSKLLISMTSQVALLTIYDMCKAVDRGMTMTGVRLLEKHGGKSGSFVAQS